MRLILAIYEGLLASIVKPQWRVNLISPPALCKNKLRLIRTGRARARKNRLFSPHVIQSGIPLSRGMRHGAVARGASSPLRPSLEACCGELSDPPTDRRTRL